MKIFFFIFFLFLAGSSVAQTLYLDSAFSKVERRPGTYRTRNNEEIGFTYYAPENAKGSLPLIVYVHGGAFAEGNRDFFSIADFANAIARRGFAVASVSYRLYLKGIGFGCDVNTEKKIAAIDTASVDVSYAIKHMVDNKEMFAIDPQKIILIGSSAGALTVLNMVYGQKAQRLPAGVRYSGVISMAGALTTVNNITPETAVPTLLFHGTEDRSVPYDTTREATCTNKENRLMLYGPAPIAGRLKAIGASYYLYTIAGGSHSWCDLPTSRCFDDIVDFLANDCFKSGSKRQTERTIHSKE